MDDARIDRSTAKSDEDQATYCPNLTKRKKHRKRTQSNHNLSGTNQLGIRKLHRQKTVKRTTGSNTNKEHAGKEGGSLCGNALAACKVGARPQNGGLLKAAIAEEGQHDGLCAGNAHRLSEWHGLGGFA